MWEKVPKSNACQLQPLLWTLLNLVISKCSHSLNIQHNKLKFCRVTQFDLLSFPDVIVFVSHHLRGVYTTLPICCTRPITVFFVGTSSSLASKWQRCLPHTFTPEIVERECHGCVVMKQLKQLQRKPRKHSEAGFDGIPTHDLRDTGAMLYKLSYEALYFLSTVHLYDLCHVHMSF